MLLINPRTSVIPPPSTPTSTSAPSTPSSSSSWKTPCLSSSRICVISSNPIQLTLTSLAFATSSRMLSRMSARFALQHSSGERSRAASGFSGCYLALRDAHFPHHPALFVREDSSIPTCSWFLGRLHEFFDKDITGHSLRAGGATSLAEAGVAPEKIQAIGRWALNTFHIYMRKNPTLLQSML
ncbi:hypothetical protein K438DRAFT_2099940, partial [Mycena galopus ATCC 62051]